MAGGKQRKLPTSSFNSLCLNDDRLAGIEGAGRGCQLIDGNLGGRLEPTTTAPGSGMFEMEKLFTLNSQQRLEGTRHTDICL
jgi:hypothetical protein